MRELVGYLLQQADYFVAVDAVPNRDLQVDLRPVPRQIADNLNVAAGYGMNGAVGVAQHGFSQCHRLDDALNARDFDSVAYVVLVFGENEETVNKILHQRLSAKADSDTGDSGAGEQRTHINAEQS